MTMGPVVMNTNCWDLWILFSTSKHPCSQSNTEWVLMLLDLAGSVFLRLRLDLALSLTRCGLNCDEWVARLVSDLAG